MSTLTENIPLRLERKVNAIKEMTDQNETKLDNEPPSEENWDDEPIPSMSSEDEVKQQRQNDDNATVKTHRRSGGGHYKSFFQPLPSPRNVLPRTLKCDPSPNVSCAIVVDAANEAGDRTSDDAKQDVVGTQPQLMQPEQQQIQREQPESADAPSRVAWGPGEAADEDEQEFNGCCDACLYYTIKCCDFLSLI